MIIVMKYSVDEQNRDVIDLWNIFVMSSKGKISVMKEIDRFRGAIDLCRESIWEVLLYIYIYIYGFVCVCVCACARVCVCVCEC